MNYAHFIQMAKKIEFKIQKNLKKNMAILRKVLKIISKSEFLFNKI